MIGDICGRRTVNLSNCLYAIPPALHEPTNPLIILIMAQSAAFRARSRFTAANWQELIQMASANIYRVQSSCRIGAGAPELSANLKQYNAGIHLVVFFFLDLPNPLASSKRYVLQLGRWTCVLNGAAEMYFLDRYV